MLRSSVAIVVGLLLSLPGQSAVPRPTDWPEITRECRPWAYWWWPGSAVTEAELTRQLEYHRKAGMGGLHIVPIYGVKGYEDRYIPFLSREWMRMLDHTTREAAWLDLGIDMTLGTGWPFGGPWVGSDTAARHLFLEVLPATTVVQCSRQPDAPCQALLAVATSGEMLDLTPKLDAQGRLDWRPPRGSWTLYAVFDGWTKQQVKRAAPGDEGNVMDFFSRPALDAYLSRFDAAFGGYKGRMVRSFYNDSYEVYGANWTPRLFEEFERRRGYDLRAHLPALAGKDDAESVSRVRSDYRETISDLLYEDFTKPWVAWCHQRGALTRNQAHGSPGNLIDLYGAADVPETEGFGAEGADILTSKLASSAAHLAGRRLVSSETFTWLGEHFQVSLNDARRALDAYFLAGINHVFYHGIPYSPAEAPWPGWLFYASTHFGESNSFARQLPDLNRLIARCQSLLQHGEPDNDLLLYLPYYDLWAVDRGSSDLLQFCWSHKTEDWFQADMRPTYAAAKWLYEKGYTFDYVSDRVLAGMAEGSSAVLAARYRAVVVAGCERMPLSTLEALVQLARQGSRVIFVDGLPRTVPGWNAWREREAKLRAQLDSLALRPLDSVAGMTEAPAGKGMVMAGTELPPLLERAHVPRESMADRGLEFVRLKEGEGTLYFVANRTDKQFDGWLPVAAQGEAAVLFDPLRERSGMAVIRHDESDGLEVHMEVPAGESRFLRVLARPVKGPAWVYRKLGAPQALEHAAWRVEFISGRPSLPKDWTTDELKSWTLGSDPALRDFSGTARYVTTFTAPDERADGWMLDLGAVHESARVYLNGAQMGDLWCEPYRIELGRTLKPGRNTLTVEVANLMANRIAAMDRARVPWRKFFFVNLRYRDFDASEWEPRPSGLLGPVGLIPYTRETQP